MSNQWKNKQLKQKGGGVFKTANNNNANANNNNANANDPNFDPIQAEIQRELEKKAEMERQQRQEAEKQKILKSLNKKGGNNQE